MVIREASAIWNSRRLSGREEPLLKNMFSRTITYRNTATGWRLRYVGDNHEIIGTAEGYDSKQSCLNGIRLLQEARHAQLIKGNPEVPLTWVPYPTPGVRRIFWWESSPRNWRWRYSGANGEAIWAGEGFTTEAACKWSFNLIQLAYLAQVKEELPSPFESLRR